MGPNLHLKKKIRHVEKQIKPQYNILSDFKKKISQILKANFKKNGMVNIILSFIS